MGITPAKGGGEENKKGGGEVIASTLLEGKKPSLRGGGESSSHLGQNTALHQWENANEGKQKEKQLTDKKAGVSTNETQDDIWGGRVREVVIILTLGLFWGIRI